MRATRPFCALAILSLLANAGPSAQTPARGDPRSVNITLTTESDHVRFTTPGEALDWRLEVATPQGDSIFDSGVVATKVLEWPLIDPQGRGAEDGVYSYTLTIGTNPTNLRVQQGRLQIERVQSVYRISALGHDVAGSGVVVTAIDASQAPVGGFEQPAPPVVPAREPFRRSLGAVSFARIRLPLEAGRSQPPRQPRRGSATASGELRVERPDRWSAIFRPAGTGS